jgi:hypothetical protein
MRLQRLGAASALVLAALGGSRSAASSDWQTFGRVVAKSPVKEIVREPAPRHIFRTGGTWVHLQGVTNANPVALRIVLKGPKQPPYVPPTVEDRAFSAWIMDCWNGVRGVEVVSGPLHNHRFPLILDLTNKVPGGVKAWDYCSVFFLSRQASPGVEQVLLQARYS